MSQQTTRLDRNEELKVFENMLSNANPDRILFIHAEGAHIFRYQPRVLDETGTNLTEMINFQFPNSSDDRGLELLDP